MRGVKEYLPTTPGQHEVEDCLPVNVVLPLNEKQPAAMQAETILYLRQLGYGIVSTVQTKGKFEGPVETLNVQHLVFQLTLVARLKKWWKSRKG